jgi:hypothetical protein
MPDVYTMFAWAVAALALVLGAQVFGLVGLLVIVVVGFVLITLWGAAAGRRAAASLARREARFQRTEEVFRDARSGEVTRVYVDPATGERRYWRD